MLTGHELTGIILLIGSIMLFLAIVGWGLPKWLLRTKYAITAPEGRGLRRCICNGKRCVVYEAGVRLRRYMPQYLLTEGEDCKKLKCKLVSGLQFLEYDVVVFDRYDKVVQVLNIKEDVILGEYTRWIELPAETSYVSILLRRVDQKEFSTAALLSVPRSNVAWFAIATFFLTVAESFILKVSCSYAFGGVFRESFIASAEGTLVSLAVSCVISLVSVISVLIAIRLRVKKQNYAKKQ